MKNKKGKEIIKLLPEIVQIFKYVSFVVGKTKTYYSLGEKREYANILKKQYGLTEKNVNDLKDVLISLYDNHYSE